MKLCAWELRTRFGNGLWVCAENWGEESGRRGERKPEIVSCVHFFLVIITNWVLGSSAAAGEWLGWRGRESYFALSLSLL